MYCKYFEVAGVHREDTRKERIWLLENTLMNPIFSAGNLSTYEKAMPKTHETV
jgi:hypothetical protein